MKADTAYAKFFSDLAPEDYERMRTSDGKGTFVFKLKNCPTTQIEIEERKRDAVLTFNVAVKITGGSAFLAFAKSKEMAITPKTKGFFGGKEISGIEVALDDVLGLTDIVDDARLSGYILRLFKTHLVDMFAVEYAKGKACRVITSIKKDVEVIEKADLPIDFDYSQVTKQLVDVVMALAERIQARET